MSASSMPTVRPMSRKPSARLTAVVDLPTPPLPDATAMIDLTPSGACAALGPPRCAGALAAGAAPCAAGAGRRALGGQRHHGDCTPGTARTAASAALRTGSQRGTAAASTLIEKNTLPSVTTTSDSAPRGGQRLAMRACDFGERVENLVLGHRHAGLLEAASSRPAAHRGLDRACRGSTPPRLTDAAKPRNDRVHHKADRGSAGGRRWRRWRFSAWASWATPWPGT